MTTGRAKDVATAETDALQACLAGEHAAVWILALLGARTSASTQPTLYAAVRAAYEWHTRTRDDLTSTIAGLGLTPVVAAPAYQQPPDLQTPDGVTAAALALEQGCARTFVAMVAATVADLRLQAVAWLDQTAVRALSFRGTPEMFPGAGEFADR